LDIKWPGAARFNVKTKEFGIKVRLAVIKNKNMSLSNVFKNI
jgi:hypothetical protein